MDLDVARIDVETTRLRQNRAHELARLRTGAINDVAPASIFVWMASPPSTKSVTQY